jgi:ankyrin repeat protein
MLRRTAIIIVILSVMTGCAKSLSLVAASKEGDLGAVKKLIESRSDEYGETDKCMAMIWSADYGYLDIVQYLATHGQVSVNCSAGGGWTPLLGASASNQMDVLKYLMERGARVEVRTILGLSPLIAAAQRGHADVVKLLLLKGADLDWAIAYLKGDLRENPNNGETKAGLALLDSMKKQLSPIKKP